MEQAWLDELSEWLRIPSVSAAPAHNADVRRAGEWLRDFIRSAGGDAEVVETRSQPLVVGEIRASSGAEEAPTVLAYGHFDVQPPEPLELWESPPFEPEMRDGWLYGRGVADDKGQLYLLLKAAADLAAEGALPVNVRVASDGEEESGGTTIVDWIAEDDRGADVCVIFDGGIERRDRPQLCTGTRGVIAFDVKVRSGARDLHSGMYGNAALNAIHALNDALAAMLPRDGRVPQPLRQGLEPVDELERRSWQELPDGADYLDRAGARPYDERAAEEFWLRTTAEPSVDVNGILGGKPGLRNTTIPVAAQANFTIRLAAGQDVETVARAAEQLLRDATPRGAEIEVEYEGTPAGYLAPDEPALELAAEVFERVWGAPTLRARLGGTLPIFPALADAGIPAVLTGIALPESNVHSPNERLLLELVPLGYRAARELYLSFARLR